MKKKGLTDFELYQRFKKEKLPKFETFPVLDYYFFCLNMACKKCLVEYECNNKASGRDKSPRLTKEEYRGIVKKHPEYLL